MKVLKSVLAVAVLGSFAFGASVADNASNVSKKIFENQKKASVLEAQIKELCKDSFKLKMEAIKDLKDEDRKTFKKEFKYQMRQNLATLGKDDVYNEDICKKFMHNNHMMPMHKKPNEQKPAQMPKADKK